MKGPFQSLLPGLFYWDHFSSTDWSDTYKFGASDCSVLYLQPKESSATAPGLLYHLGSLRNILNQNTKPIEAHLTKVLSSNTYSNSEGFLLSGRVGQYDKESALLSNTLAKVLKEFNVRYSAVRLYKNSATAKEQQCHLLFKKNSNQPTSIWVLSEVKTRGVPGFKAESSLAFHRNHFQQITVAPGHRLFFSDRVVSLDPRQDRIILPPGQRKKHTAPPS
jgi:hypothetical protein